MLKCAPVTLAALSPSDCLLVFRVGFSYVYRACVYVCVCECVFARV